MNDPDQYATVWQYPASCYYQYGDNITIYATLLVGMCRRFTGYMFPSRSWQHVTS